jgi:hypothetical protein
MQARREQSAVSEKQSGTHCVLKANATPARRRTPNVKRRTLNVLYFELRWKAPATYINLCF